MLLAEYRGVWPVEDRDAIAIRYGVRLQPESPITPFSAVISGTSDLYTPEHLGIPDYNDRDANRAFIAEALIGEYLDAHGLPGPHVPGNAVPRVEILSEALESLREMKPATDEEIEQYVKARLYWSYQYGIEAIMLTTPDFFRLRISNERLIRVLRLGEGTDWKVGANTGIAQILSASLELLRAERERRRATPAAASAIAPDGRSYVHPDRISELRAISSPDFDLRRLVALCEELNLAWMGDACLAVAMLTRAIIDHVPPIFGHKTFGEVANNYAGAKSFKESMRHLHESARKIADAYLHVHIRKKESLPNANQVNFSQDLDVLLSEVVRLLR